MFDARTITIEFPALDRFTAYLERRQAWIEKRQQDSIDEVTLRVKRARTKLSAIKQGLTTTIEGD